MLRRSVFLTTWIAVAITLKCLLYLAFQPWFTCLNVTTQDYLAAAIICFLLGLVLLVMVTMSREHLLRRYGRSMARMPSMAFARGKISACSRMVSQGRVLRESKR